MFVELCDYKYQIILLDPFRVPVHKLLNPPVEPEVIYTQDFQTCQLYKSIQIQALQ